ncbi:MAG TPA: DUF4390 domain-containing protein [Vicinamibacterales bacterium]|nr:DUF4390 domain-containing protein [Vicinamibacterales bacterium]
MTRAAGLWTTATAAAAIAGSAVVIAAEIQVKPVVASDGRVLASFVAPGAFTDETRGVVKTGLTLTFSYDVELRRPSTLWFDPTLARTRVAASVRFDSLTATYQVSKERDGRVFWSDKSNDEARVRELMTSFDQVALEPASPLEPNVEYYVRVRLYASPRSTVIWFWPWGRDDGSGRADFTYIR